MLRLGDGQVECLWDEILPVEARELPEDLAGLDGLLADRALLAPIEARWRLEAEAAGAFGGFAWSADDLDAELCAVDGGQAPHGLGV
jgi:hypothetical protein